MIEATRYRRVSRGVWAVQYALDTWTMTTSRDLGLPLTWQEYAYDQGRNPRLYGLWRGFYLATDNGFTLLHDGDWIVWDAHGHVQTYSPELFERVFVAIDDEEKEAAS